VWSYREREQEKVRKGKNLVEEESADPLLGVGEC